MSTAAIPQQYRIPLWRMDRALRNSFVGSSIFGVCLIILVLVMPAVVPEPVTVTTVPERIARLIIEKPKPMPPSKSHEKPGGGGGGGGTPKAGTPEGGPIEVAQPKVEPRPTPGRAAREPAALRSSPDKGVQGRARATQEVTQNVAQVSGSLDRVLENISQALPASTRSKSSAGVNVASANTSARARRQRGVSTSARSSEQLGSVGGVSGISGADVSGSAIASEGISIAAITDLTVGGGGGGDGTPYGTPGGTGLGGSGGGFGGGNGSGTGTGTGPGRGSGSGGGTGGGQGTGTGDGSGAGNGGGSGYRSNESLLSVVRRYAPGIQFCYDNELKKTPNLRGKIVVAITVLASGEVSDATVVENSLGSRGVSDCILAQIRGWHFPAIPYGVTSFRAPFVFTPPN
jgi:TonB family protein